MKHLSLILIMLIFGINLFAQKIGGIIENEINEKIPSAIIKIQENDRQSTSDKNGYFEFKNVKRGDYTIEISFIGYETLVKKVSVKSKDINISVKLKQSDIIADEVIVTATRADNKTPIAYTNLNQKDIDKHNNGQDIPYLLDLTPSVVITSDAGAGVGYTGMRIRGTDMTRINVTLDGIPLNDPESHGVWWVDLPDFASSVNSIQVQRGVGTSSNGAAAFGANVNLISNKINKETYAELNQTYGSFNTYKSTVKAGTGVIKKHFVLIKRTSLK